jgi:hypothetical protein
VYCGCVLEDIELRFPPYGRHGRRLYLNIPARCNGFIHIADLECLGELLGSVFAEVEFDGRVGVEVIEGGMPVELDPAMLEVIDQGFSFFNQDEPFTVLDDHPDDADEPDGVSEDPLRGRLHPADALSFG